MLYRWVIPKGMLTDYNRAHKKHAHNSLWELDFGAISKFGCFGTVIDIGEGDNDYVVGQCMEVQWPCPYWEQVDELEESVREVRADAGIGG
jgi:hypothetical protein